MAARIGDGDELVVADHAEMVVDQVRVRRALAELPERGQEALWLVAWEGLDAGAAATVMG